MFGMSYINSSAPASLSLLHTQQSAGWLCLKHRLQLEMGMWQHGPGGEGPEIISVEHRSHLLLQ